MQLYLFDDICHQNEYYCIIVYQCRIVHRYFQFIFTGTMSCYMLLTRSVYCSYSYFDYFVMHILESVQRSSDKRR